MSLLVRFSQANAQSCDPGATQIGTACLTHHSSSGGSPFLPVLFIHGIQLDDCGKGGGTETWGQAIDLLKGEGIDVWEFQYVSGDFIDDSAQFLSQAVNTILSQTVAPHIRIIAHSLGGLVTRTYIQDQGGSASVDRLLTFGTPHLGYRDSLCSRDCYIRVF
jgi:triacylglycerol esterase/lipase EstA (alpha/beta hydrolase family)